MAKVPVWDNKRMIELIHEIKKESNENVSLWSLQSLRNFGFIDGYASGQKSMGKTIIENIKSEMGNNERNGSLRKTY